MYGDIVKGLPLPPSCAAAVYCSHVLEHLSLEDFRTALLSTLSMLVPGGIFRLVLPDLEHEVRRYLHSESADAAMDFMCSTYLGHETRPRGFKSS